MTHNDDLTTEARKAALDILAEWGRNRPAARITDLLALAYMRGNVAGIREANAVRAATARHDELRDTLADIGRGYDYAAEVMDPVADDQRALARESRR